MGETSLAGVLTAVGLAFVYVKNAVGRAALSSRLSRVMPVISSLVITGAGVAMSWQALPEAGIDMRAMLNGAVAQVSWLSSASILGLGLLFGLKHALDADHVAAVSIIVSERKSILSSSLVGAFWGVGHTLALLAAAVVVIFLHVEISARAAQALELLVACMLIALGAIALRRLLGGSTLHLHAHQHGGRVHFHPHIHDDLTAAASHTHHGWHAGARPLVVGLVHGLAGSGGLMLLVLSTIRSPLLGFLYVAVFGLGSIGGMLLMSILVGLPVHLTAAHFGRANLAVRTFAAIFSVGLGLFMVYEIGVIGRLLL